MKIKIIEVEQVENDSISLQDCGFKIGDIVEVSGSFNDGCVSVQVIRDTEFVSVGNQVSILENEYEVVEE